MKITISNINAWRVRDEAPSAVLDLLHDYGVAFSEHGITFASAAHLRAAHDTLHGIMKRDDADEQAQYRIGENLEVDLACGQAVIIMSASLTRLGF